MTTRDKTPIWMLAAVSMLVLGLGCQTQSGGSKPGAEMGAEGSEPEVMDRGQAIVTEPDGLPKELRTIYFGFDSSALRMAAKTDLKYNAEVLRQHASAGITVEGNCDARGSNEYNLALGKRRADAARRYLVDLGVASARISTVSFGEERPAVRGSGEAVWAKNRRDEFLIR